MFCYDITPSPGNPRNSEGAFCLTDEKELIFVYTSFRGESFEDHAHADISLMRSRDSGITWNDPELVVRYEDHGAMNIMSVSMLRMKNGDIGLFYLVRIDWLDMYVVLRRSGDGGRTWSAPHRCTRRKGYYVMNNDRAVRTSSGRIILPIAEHENSVDREGKLNFAPAKTVFFCSDDDGETFFEVCGKLYLDCPDCRSGLQEPGVIETAQGCLYGWARTDLGRQYEFFSEDNGSRWSAARPSRFTSPLSPLSMKKLNDGRFIAVWNPVPADDRRKTDRITLGRTPLVYAVSPDQGKTWSAPRVIEDDVNSGYCYTTIFPMDDRVLTAYCAGGEKDRGCLNRLRLRVLPSAGIS